MGFLSVMLAFMALRQALTLKAKFTSANLTFSSLDTEWPGIVVSVMAFLAVYYLGKILTERKRISNDQEMLIEKLERQNLELEQFTYTVSHDLKTPLVTITGFLGYLRQHFEKGDLEAFERDLSKINQAAKGMALSLDELLELSRVGRVVHPFESVSLDQLTEEALTKVENQLFERNVKLHVDPDMPEVFVDRVRLLEVLIIMIDNAIKFGGQKVGTRIEIGSRIEPLEVVYFVRDNGIGIDPEYHDYVFGLFDRIVPHVEGSGVGLTLAKRIIEFHQGRIWVESEGNGSGSTVLFALPLDENLPTESAA